jgi:hypothetical protein
MITRYAVKACLFFVLAGTASAADISTYSFNSGLNCNGVRPLPDTGQTISYTGTFGEDHDYQTSAMQPRFTVLNPVGVSSVTVDNVTGLMWVTNPKDPCATCPGGYVSMGSFSWEQAMAQCEGIDYAGYTDWRLPNIKELSSIVDFTAQNPSINTTYFMNTITGNNWSSTTYVGGPAGAWNVVFSYGFINSNAKTFGYYVRCVRGN